MFNKFKAQNLNRKSYRKRCHDSRCHDLASRALNMSGYFAQSARSIESRCVVTYATEHYCSTNILQGYSTGTGKIMQFPQCLLAKRKGFRLDWSVPYQNVQNSTKCELCAFRTLWMYCTYLVEQVVEMPLIFDVMTFVWLHGNGVKDGREWAGMR